MGCGKSQTGKTLANKLSYKFTDIDTIIQEKTNLSISNIFQTKGEKWFREYESELLYKLSKENNIVIATGGGTASNINNINTMLDTGEVIYLKAEANLLCNRIKTNKQQRPLISNIKDSELLEFVKKLLSQRSKYYEMANIIINTNSMNIEDIVGLISQKIKE